MIYESPSVNYTELYDSLQPYNNLFNRVIQFSIFRLFLGNESRDRKIASTEKGFGDTTYGKTNDSTLLGIYNKILYTKKLAELQTPPAKKEQPRCFLDSSVVRAALISGDTACRSDLPIATDCIQSAEHLKPNSPKPFHLCFPIDPIN